MAIKNQKSHLRQGFGGQAKFKIQNLGIQKIKKFLPQSLKDLRSFKPFYLALLIIGLAILFSYKKSWIIAATVNNSPVSNFELLAKMNQQYRTQTLTQMINEKIILDEAKKNKVAVTDQEVTEQIAKLEQNVGGSQTLDSLLSQQGQTRDSLKDQIKIQLTIEKLYSQEAIISAEEITQFVKENKDQLQATTSAEQQTEAADALKQQKLGKVFNEKFQAIKQAAQIQTF